MQVVFHEEFDDFKCREDAEIPDEALETQKQSLSNFPSICKKGECKNQHGKCIRKRKNKVIEKNTFGNKGQQKN